MNIEYPEAHFSEESVRDMWNDAYAKNPTEKGSVEEWLVLYHNVNESPVECINCLVIRYWV